MRLNLSNENIFLLALSTFLLALVLLFSFLVLLPKEKNHRLQKNKLQTAYFKLQKDKKTKEQKLYLLKKLNTHSQTFKKNFNPDTFKNKIQTYFTDIISMQITTSKQNNISIYKINLSAYIQSPQQFYNFIENINKDKWIIEIIQPVKFEKHKKNIKISFGIKIWIPQEI